MRADALRRRNCGGYGGCSGAMRAVVGTHVGCASPVRPDACVDVACMAHGAWRHGMAHCAAIPAAQPM
ncbi:hypothetical protein XOC_3752 [Xanthomonas oryzae pv. oryzicola BLS256]|uniref:Uncharacterized protein n=1 Tax=Xanthomonas oryzae pv. oryzicola (strain BLS256) TaxID=383407 RepID=G7TG96_XANOB|nr:hypothetical protein XOC_3752 [Xanthomonas oryzae pv. oryzicola BLS256]